MVPSLENREGPVGEAFAEEMGGVDAGETSSNDDDIVLLHDGLVTATLLQDECDSRTPILWSARELSRTKRVLSLCEIRDQ